MRAGAARRRWLLERTDGQEHIQADEVEVAASGAIVFYRYAGHLESGRTLLGAWAAGTWQHCALEGDD
jgi:hypothetical protein